MTSNKPTLTILCLFILSGIGGCALKEQNKTDNVQNVLADSAQRAEVVQRIAEDPALRGELLHQMSMQMNRDTTVAGQVCSMVIHRARTDTSLAEHICTVVGSDTMMSRMMAKKLGSRPAMGPGAMRR